MTVLSIIFSSISLYNLIFSSKDPRSRYFYFFYQTGSSDLAVPGYISSLETLLLNSVFWFSFFFLGQFHLIWKQNRHFSRWPQLLAEMGKNCWSGDWLQIWEGKERLDQLMNLVSLCFRCYDVVHPSSLPHLCVFQIWEDKERLGQHQIFKWQEEIMSEGTST